MINLNKDSYKKSFDSLTARSDFESDTEKLLRSVLAERNNTMKSRKNIIVFASAILAVVLMAGSVYAAVALLSPKEVALNIGDPTLAAAFESEDAVIINETKQAGEYNVTLMGIVSGKSLSDWHDTDSSYSYVCFAIEKSDGTAMSITDDMGIQITPLIEGYQPWCVNLFCLSNGANGNLHNGVYYMLYSFETLEMFADHEVAFYVYSESHAPGSDTFSFDESTGKIDYHPDYTGARAKFDLPLDSSKADPEAARQYLTDFGFELDENGKLILE